ncbi:MAG: hypothetical protein SW833_00755 [Cyanobacteriota bacterium]|nr:hypothetical protein [Cyanobacteriota bacterium]
MLYKVSIFVKDELVFVVAGQFSPQSIAFSNPCFVGNLLQLTQETSTRRDRLAESALTGGDRCLWHQLNSQFWCRLTFRIQTPKSKMLKSQNRTLLNSRPLASSC